MGRRRVLVESPFAGDVEENQRYLRLAMRDCLLNHNEAPFASHELYTRCLDDLVPIERAIGIEAGLCWGAMAEATVVYIDRGISPGMRRGINAAARAGRRIEFRTVPGYAPRAAVASTG